MYTQARIWAEENVDELLDECYGFIEICGARFYASRILQKCDPIMYEMVIYDEADFMLGELKNEQED